MDRRTFLAGSVALLAAPLAAEAQPTRKVWRIGYLDQGSASRSRASVDGFKQGLRDHGWVEGRTIAIEVRFAEGKTDQLPRLAAELVHLKVDLIVTSSTPAALAAKHATQTIPIVIGFAADPVGSGIVASLAHPGGNITGWTHSGLELRAKYLELLKEAVPEATRVGVLWNPANQVHQPSLKVIEGAAQKLKVELAPGGRPRPPRDRACLLGVGSEGCAGSRCLPRRDVSNSDTVDHRPCCAAPSSCPIRSHGVRGARRSDGLWGQSAQDAPAARRIPSGQDSEGCPARKPSRRATDRVRSAHQPQDRQDARPHDPASLLVRANRVIE